MDSFFRLYFYALIRDCFSILIMYQNTDDYEDILLDASSASESSSVIPNKMTDGRGSCAICGAKATGINFQVLTVSSIKFINFFL